MYEFYTVKEGDSLEEIARKYDIPIYDIVTFNSLENIYELPVGLELKIPRKGDLTFEVYNVKKGDSLYSIARNKNISVDNLAILNGLDINSYIYPNQQLLVPKDGVIIYLTKLGDSLQTLAMDNNVKPEDLLIYNNRIYLLPEQLIALKK